MNIKKFLQTNTKTKNFYPKLNNQINYKKIFSDTHSKNLDLTKCVNCGRLVQPGKPYCSKKCRDEYLYNTTIGLPLKKDTQSKNMVMQSFFRASNEAPSQTIKKKGYAYAFSNPEEATTWKKKFNYKDIYQVTTDNYDLDPGIKKGKTYIRDTPTGKRLNDNEWIIKGVLQETKINKDEETKTKMMIKNG